jgi:hypothetical protein
VNSLAKVQTSSTHRQTCPFPKPPADFEERKSNSSSLEMTITPTVALQGFEKIRIDAATSCKIENFRYHCEIGPAKSSGLSFPQKAQTFREERKV